MNHRVTVRFQGCCYQDEGCCRFDECSTVRFSVTGESEDDSAEFTACVVPPSGDETLPTIAIFPEAPEWFDLQALQLAVNEYYSVRVLEHVRSLPPRRHANAKIELPWVVYFAVGDDGPHRWHPFAFRTGV